MPHSSLHRNPWLRNLAASSVIALIILAAVFSLAKTGVITYTYDDAYQVQKVAYNSYN